MKGAPQGEQFDERSEFGYRSLYEAALRLLAALGSTPVFPADVATVERLLEAVAADRREVWKFAAEIPGALPRFSGRHQTWVCPNGDGSLRLRTESGSLEAYAATVTPDGRFFDFAHERGFGVPDSELTPQARADREEVERRVREAEVEAEEFQRRGEEGQRRFLVERLRGVAAAPWQDPAGPVVAWVAYYDSGLVVSIVVPAAADDECPGLEVTDDLGNPYEAVDVIGLQRHRPAHHYLLGLSPAAADGASQLVLRGGAGSVDVEVVR